MAFNGMISSGELITATSIAVIMIFPVQELVGTLGSMWAISLASTQRVLELLNAESHPATEGTVQLHGNDHFVAFEKLKLANGSIDSRIEPDEFVSSTLRSQQRRALPISYRYVKSQKRELLWLADGISPR